MKKKTKNKTATKAKSKTSSKTSMKTSAKTQKKSAGKSLASKLASKIKRKKKTLDEAGVESPHDPRPESWVKNSKQMIEKILPQLAEQILSRARQISRQVRRKGSRG